MATLLLAAIPANSFWSAALIMLGGYIDSQLFGANVNQEVGKVNDFQMQTASYGTAIPLIVGTSRTTGNVIWTTKFVEHTKTETQTQGGKGGGGKTKTTTTTYYYTISLAVGICQGPINSIGRVWADGKLINLSNYQHTIYYGNEEQTPDNWLEAIEGNGNVPAFRGLAYIVFKNLNISEFGNRIPSFSFEITRTITDLKALVETISINSGLQYSDVDASDLQGIQVIGLESAGDKTGRSIIEQLQSTFMFDAIERNGKVVFKRRSSNVGYEVSADLLGAYETTPAEEPYKIEYKDERELPRRLTINYLSKDKDYQQGTMSAYRQITKSKNEQTINIKMVLSDSEAKQLAELRLFELWQSRKTLSINLSNTFGWVLPGDILKLPINDEKQNFMITKTTYGKPGLIKIEAVATAFEVYIVSGRKVDCETNPVIPSAPGEIISKIVDLPLLPGETSTDRIFIACEVKGVFYGANIFRSSDGGATWLFVDQSTQLSTIGNTLSVLPPGNTITWDENSTIDIKLTNGTLESRPAIDVLNNFNAALIGEEIVQFRQAELISEDTYRLSGLLRGRLGTEDQIYNHNINETFIMLDTLKMLNYSSSDLYLDKLYRVGPVTLPVTDETYIDYIINIKGIGARPYSVCHVTSSRDIIGNLTISWIRRTRINGDWRPYIDVPLGETMEAYEVDIILNEKILRTISINKPQAIYTASQQIDDFGKVQASIKVRIYQISEVYGRGAVKEEIL